MLVLLAARDRGERLTVKVPYADAAYEQLRAVERLRLRAWIAELPAVVTLLLLTAWLDLGLAGFVLTGAAALTAAAAAIVGGSASTERVFI